MEVTEKRNIESGTEYDHLFPKSKKEVTVIKRKAKLEDTIKFLPQAIEQTLYQTEKIAAQLASELSVFDQYAFCKHVWNWVYRIIRYRKDEPNKEQIQSPQYTMAVRAGDCDDYTVMIVSILSHIEGIRLVLRISMYTEENGYQHIYPVAFLADGTQVIMDCVAKKFNYEVPYIKKIDKNMELQFLNGLPETRNDKPKLGIDADDLLDGYDGDDVGDLGRGKAKTKGKFREKLKSTVKKIQNSKVATTVRKGLHIANRLNPAAALLRTGILTALKTNLFKIAERLRFSYLTPQQAQSMNLDMAKYNRLIGIRDQLEKVFFRAGGKVENFKKNILTGRGNRDKQIPLSGLGAIDYNDYTQQNSIRQILGVEMYNSEVQGVEGFGELGVATTAAVAAATTVLSAIAALLKSVGDLRKKKSTSEGGDGGGDSASSDENAARTVETPSADQDSNDMNSGGGDASFSDDNSSIDQTQNGTDTNTNSKSNGGGGGNGSSNTGTPSSSDKAESSTDQSASSETEDSSTGEDSNASDQGAGGSANKSAARSATTTNAKSTNVGMFTKMMNWAKANPLPATGIAIVVVGGVTYGLVKFFKGDKKEHKPKAALSGLPHKKRKKHYHSHKFKHHKLK